ncbi:MAG: class I SAM-dependent methyltransferase [Patescibacteria group bacterium]
MLDLCTGSGALAIALANAARMPGYGQVMCLPKPWLLLRRNAARHETRIHFRQGDFFLPFVHQRFDMIVCNPPYIPSAALAGLQAEVRFEPSLALDGGDDGLHFYRRLFSEAPDYLNRKRSAAG